MFNFIFIIIRFVFSLISKKNKDIIVENMVLKKENQILKRKKRERIKFRFFDRIFYTVFNKLSGIAKDSIILIKPKTILNWQRNLMNNE